MNGRGKCTYPGGSVYDGEFKDDKCHGRGKCTWPDGKVYDGEWKDDKIVERSELNWGSLRNDGFKAAELYESSCNVFELRELFAMSRDGFSIRELFSSGCDFSDILEIGFVRSDFDREHLSCKEIFDADFPSSWTLDSLYPS